jgi:UDP-N-acetylglucosamine--N-acetylmuramyl-(pentapeptide) pyrophosphoryl-undecaprenol N-acetylglucosamine transferase
MSVVGYVSGNSGGHLVPLITLAMEEKKQNHETQLIFFTTKKSIDETYIKNTPNGLIDKHIAYNLSDVPVNFFAKIYYCFRIFYFFVLSLFSLWKYDIQQLHTTGSYIALPVCLAAKTLNIPIYLYHVDAYPGKASQKIQSLATTIFYSFDITKKLNFKYANKMLYRNYPIRFSNKNIYSSEEAKKILNIPQYKKVILILGGSQGSMEINHACIEAFKKFDQKNNIYVFHQTGNLELNYLKENYNQLEIQHRVQSFYDNLELIYTAADKIITRAGAGSLAEIAFFKKPALIIPLKNCAQNHQVHNGKIYAEQYPKIMSLTLTENNELINTILKFLEFLMN